MLWDETAAMGLPNSIVVLTIVGMAGLAATVIFISDLNPEYLSSGMDPDPDNNGILTDMPPNLVAQIGGRTWACGCAHRRQPVCDF